MFLFVYALITQTDLFHQLEPSITAFNNYLNGSFTVTLPYRIKKIDLNRTYIKIRIDPCNGQSNALCCEGNNEGICQDNPVTYKGPNLQIAWSCNNIVTICYGSFYQTTECGTYIEVHYPGNMTLINDIQINTFSQSGFHQESIYTRDLLPGKYELWWVQRDRTGRWIFYIKPFYIAY